MSTTFTPNEKANEDNAAAQEQAEAAAAGGTSDQRLRPGETWHHWYERTAVMPPSDRYARPLQAMVARGMSDEVVVEIIRRARDGKADRPLAAAAHDLGELLAAGVRTLTDLAALEQARKDRGRAPRAQRAPAAPDNRSPPRRSNVFLPGERKPDEYYEQFITNRPRAAAAEPDQSQ